MKNITFNNGASILISDDFLEELLELYTESEVTVTEVLEEEANKMIDAANKNYDHLSFNKLVKEIDAKWGHTYEDIPSELLEDEFNEKDS